MDYNVLAVISILCITTIIHRLIGNAQERWKISMGIRNEDLHFHIDEDEREQTK